MSEKSVEQVAIPMREEVAPPAPHARLVFAIVLAAGFLDVVDFSIVQVALPTIQRELLVSLTDSQWIIGAYGLTMAGFLMLSGRAGDIYGQKRLFIAGLAVFSLASLTAGFAPSFLVLVASRAMQGVGAAITTATALSILAATFPEGKARNRAFGIFIAVLSAGFAAAALAGGVLTASLGWRSVMFVNVPIGAAAVVLSLRYLGERGGRATDRRLDLPGALAVTSGLMLLVYALTNAADAGFASLQTMLPLVLSALILAGFVAIESRSKAPLMPLGFLRRGTVMAANVLGLIVAASAGGMVFLLTIFLQQILGYSALSAGLSFLPPAIIFFVVGGWGAAWLLNRFGMKPVLVTSLALITVGSALLTQISIAGGYVGLLPGLLLWSLGASIGFPAITIAALAGTRPGEEGLASGLVNTSMRVGGPLGLAVLLTVASVTSAQTLGLEATAGVVGGFRYAFGASAILNGIGLLIAVLIGRRKSSTA